MKFAASLLLVSASSLLAQASHSAAGRPATHPAPARHASPAAGAACVTVPDLSPGIPALPAGSPCPHALYTLSTVPSIKLDYVSPLEGSSLGETLGIDTSTFSLAYVDTKAGAGPLAEPHKWYTIHYNGYLADGTKFDSSVDRGQPIVIHIGEHQVIPGWDTGFAGMHVGGKRRLFIPYQLAYGSSGRPPQIPPKSELIFDVELVAQDDTEPAPKPAPTAAPSGQSSTEPANPSTSNPAGSAPGKPQ